MELFSLRFSNLLSLYKAGNVCITWHRGAFKKPLLPWKRNEYYIFLCVCVRVLVRGPGHARACVCVCNCASAAVCLCAISLTNPESNALPYCFLRPPCFQIFRHDLTNDTTFWETLLNINWVFWFSLQLLFRTFLIITIIQWDIFIDVETSSCKVSVTLVEF